MAIVVEQEQSGRGGIGKILVWVVIVLILLIGAYYLFFKRPDVIPSLAAPAGFQQASSLSGVKLDPGTVVQSATFQSLKPQAPEMPSPSTGRSNPFFPL